MNEELVRNEILQGLLQVDSSFVLTSFDMWLIEGRRYKISFSAVNSAGQEINTENYYG